MTPGDGRQLRGWLYHPRLGLAPGALLYRKPIASAAVANETGHNLWQWYFWPAALVDFASNAYAPQISLDRAAGFGFMVAAAFGAAAPPPKPVASVITVAQQGYQDPPSFISGPLQGARPQPIPYVSGAPQPIDLTQPAALIKSLTGPQGPTIRPLSGYPLPVDLTQQATVLKPLMGPQGPTVRPVAGSPLPVDLTPTSTFWRPIPASQGPVPALSWAAVQFDLTLQGSITTAALPAQLLQGFVPALLSGSPQAADFTLQGWVRGTAPLPQGRTPALVQAQPQSDPTPLATIIWSPAVRPAVLPSAVVTFFITAPQFGLTTPLPVVSAPLSAAAPVVISPLHVYPLGYRSMRLGGSYV